MKKLLAAVTSIVMSASFVTSAFTSSFNVSAAGGSSAVQPNVSLEGVLDGTANKTVQEDFVVTGAEVKYDPSKPTYIDFYVESNGHKGATIVFEVAEPLPAGITYKMSDAVNYAIPGEPGWVLSNRTYRSECRDSKEFPQSFIDGESVCNIELNVPANIADGTYEIGLERFHVVEQASEKIGPIVEFDAKVIPGKLIVGNGGTPAATTTKTNPPATTTKSNTPSAPTTTAKPTTPSGDVQADFIVRGAEVKYDPTKDTYIDFFVESNGHKAATLVFEVEEPLPAGITFTMSDAVNYAIPGEPGWVLSNRTYRSECRDSSEYPQNFIDGESVCNIQLNVPANIAEGTYEINLERFHVVEQASEKVGPIVEFNATVIPGKLIVGDGGTPAVTTTKTPSSPAVTTTVNKPSGDVQADFIVRGAEVNYDPTKDTYIDFYVESNGHKAATLVFEVAEPLPAGITFTMSDAVNYAIPGEPGWVLSNRTYRSECRDASEYPQNFIDGESVCNIQLNVPANIAPGEYEITLERFHVVEQASEKVGPIVEFNATVIPGKLIVGGGTPAVTTTKDPGTSSTTTTKAPSTPSSPDPDRVLPDFVVTGNKVVYDPSKPTYIDFTVDSGGHKGSTLVFEIADPLPAGITGKVTELVNYAIPGEPGWVLSSKTYRCECRDASETPQSFIDGNIVCSVELTVPANIAAGEYEIDLERFHVVEQASEKVGPIVEFNATVVPGVLVVYGGSTPAVTTTKVPGTPAATTTKAPVANGEALWVIDTVKGVPGQTVEVPVYVSGNSTLEVAGATFTINSDAPFNKVSGNSAAYGNAPVTYNSATSEYAFAQAAGKGSAAADKAVIMTITYNVPANATGTIPVTWANVTVSDTNGNLITEKVKVQNGAIVIDPQSTNAPVADGEVLWVIDTVKGVPGQTVEVPVFVSGTSTLEVAGATFTINSDAPFNKVSGNSAAYGNAPVTYNSATSEYAFAQAAGKGSAAADKAVIMTITYNVPADATGTIPVTWANVTVSDTNGNLITEKVKVQNGAIVIDPDTTVAPVDPANGEAVWVIDTVHGTPGQSVDVPVFVSGASTLEVAGATFTINSDAPFNKVSGNSAAYGNAPITNNAATSEYAFAQAAGKGSAAADKAVIMTITYNVPADATGTIPVTWANVTVSDTNGNLITEKVKVENGAIIIDTPVAPGATTAAPAPITTAAPVPTTTAAPVPTTTAAPVPGATTAAPVPTTTAAPVPGATTAAPVPGATTVAPAPGTTVIPSTPAEGEVVWVIDTVKGVPGQTVDVPVFVKGASTLEVAGATFTINADAGFNKVSGNCAAYGNAPITNNAATSEYAFADASGKGSAAADKAVIMTITYNVPADATGTIPVTWANVTVSDTNGNIITEKVKVENGAIIIDAPLTTDKPSSTTLPPVNTTLAPTSVTGQVTTTATPAAPVVTTTTATPAAPVVTTTAPNAPVATTAPTPTTTLAQGAIIWQGETVTAAPGAEVALSFVVSDPNGAKLEIAGATFTIDADGNVTLVGGTGSDAYTADLQKNLDTSEFAFANAIGDGVAGADGAKVITLTFKVPEDAKDGDKYPVNMNNLVVSDENGNIITDKVITIGGMIVISAPAPITTAPNTPVVTTVTPAAPVVTTTTATPAAPVVTTTTATPAAPVVTTTTTDPNAPVVTTIAQGAIIWQGETVTAAPGEEVKLSFVVNDPNGAKLEIGGATFTIDADGNVTLVGADGSEAYKAELQKNLDISEFAFGTAAGNGVAAEDGSKVITLTFKVPEDAKDGDEFVIGMDKLVVSDTNGNIISDKVLVMDGKIVVKAPVTTDPNAPVITTTEPNAPVVTTTEPNAPVVTTTEPNAPVVTTTTGPIYPGSDTTTTTTGNVIIIGGQDVTVEVVEGYFFNHDPRSFPGDMVVAESVRDKTGEIVPFDPSKVTFEDTVNGGATPEKAYRAEETDFTYELNVFYDGEALYYEDGTRVVATAYIGVKGDSDLNNVVNSSDATNALVWYAKKMTGVTGADLRLTPDNNEIVNAHPELDGLGAFLVDVDKDCYNEGNWAKSKYERTIDAKDASWILVFYANEMTGMSGQAYENWKLTLGEDLGYGEKFEDYKANGTLVK